MLEWLIPEIPSQSSCESKIYRYWLTVCSLTFHCFILWSCPLVGDVWDFAQAWSSFSHIRRHCSIMRTKGKIHTQVVFPSGVFPFLFMKSLVFWICCHFKRELWIVRWLRRVRNNIIIRAVVLSHSNLFLLFSYTWTFIPPFLPTPCSFFPIQL